MTNQTWKNHWQKKESKIATSESLENTHDACRATSENWEKDDVPRSTVWLETGHGYYGAADLDIAADRWRILE